MVLGFLVHTLSAVSQMQHYESVRIGGLVGMQQL